MGKKVPRIEPSTPTRVRNAFDLSQKHLYTATAGQLLPIMTIDVMPHDHVEIQATDFMRTLPMNSAAFMSMRGVYEFFFVPYSQLFHPFDQMITDMKDFNSDYFRNTQLNPNGLNIPSFKLIDFLSKASDAVGRYNDIIAKKPGFDGYAPETDADIFGYPNVFSKLKLFDMLGYGKYYNLTKNSFRESFGEIAKRHTNLKLNPFRILAYNKIYQDYYMNSTYEPRDVSLYNIDSHVNEKTPLNKDYVYNLFEMKYRNAQADYLTNVRPTPLFSLPNGVERDLLDNAHVGVAHANPSLISSGRNSVNINTSGYSGLTVADIRFGFALEKLLDITQRAGKTYAEQIKAHFGVEVSEGRDGRVNYIGGFDSNIQVGDVTQTSGTTVTGKNVEYGGYLGRVTGKAQGSGSGKVTFDAKEHGLIMCIYSVVPDMQYDAYKIDPFNTKLARGDYFMPEFENLGLQPLNALHLTDKFFDSDGTTGQVYGWQPRYSEYKTALDINHGQFCDGEPLSYWTIGRGRKRDYLSTFDISILKISPSWLDSVFAVNYNGKEITDQLFGGCTFNIQKVSDMSESGMPRI